MTKRAAGALADDETVSVGGYRGGTARARFRAQLVGLVTPETRNRVVYLARRHEISQAKILRAIIGAGLAQVEADFASGKLTADTLP